ncbi:MAG: RNA pseudouridine synthase [Flavobacteriaceae bacterium]|nr:MAG: RNA pseudouridine synthase [Flavobacteriaceae bacterium]
MNIIETHTAPLQKTPIRLQEYAVGIFTTIATKSALKKAIKKKCLFVDGKLATTATFINGYEVISYYPALEANRSTSQKAARKLLLNLEIVYEDDYLAIINKPAGILSSGNAFKTVANALEQNLKKSKQVDAVQPQPVHRLDYPTTGLLMVGKTAASILALNKLFEGKKIKKTYVAVTIGAMQRKGVIDFSVEGKEAISFYIVLKTVVSKRFQHLNLVQLSPKTGRRHQLRKHLTALGNPVLGDATYCISDLILKGKGLYLHAFSLEFIHPFTQEKMHVEKELPLRFSKLFD